MPFQPGQSGNPSGRPAADKETIEARRLARIHGPAAIARLAELMTSENLKAAVSASQAILDRAYGKSPQALHHSGGEDENGNILAIPIKNVEFKGI